MEFTFNVFRTVLMLTVFSLTAAVMGASNDGQKIKSVNPVELNNQIERPSNNTTTLEVVDKDKCPEKTPGGGAGDLTGGMCYYAVPDAGCASLGSGCSESTLKGKPACKCPQEKGLTPGNSDPGQVQSPGG